VVECIGNGPGCIMGFQGRLQADAVGLVDAGNAPFVTDLNREILASKPERLARLIHGVVEEPLTEAAQGPAAALRALLSAPCGEYFTGQQGRKSETNPSERQSGEENEEGDVSPLPSNAVLGVVRELLLEANTPLVALRALKEAAKGRADAASDPFLRHAATALYYLSIGAAFTRGGKKITGLSDSQLQEGLDWVQRQSWVDSALRGLAGEASQLLRQK
jgi:hypothetical protein